MTFLLSNQSRILSQMMGHLTTYFEHCMRPVHIHFMIKHTEYNELVRTLYIQDLEYVTSGIGKCSVILTKRGKPSLMVDYKKTEDIGLAKQYEIPNPEKGFWFSNTNSNSCKRHLAKNSK